MARALRSVDRLSGGCCGGTAYTCEPGSFTGHLEKGRVFLAYATHLIVGRRRSKMGGYASDQLLTNIECPIYRADSTE